jgi:Repeat of unknown function (DUF5648)
MLKHIMRIAAALFFGMPQSGAVHGQILDQWFVRELYSNADGSVQFVKFEFDIDRTTRSVVGQTLIASHGSTERSFTLSRDFDCVLCTGGDSYGFLVGTQGFADLGVGVPDFVVPNGFLFIPAGSLRLGASEVRYEALPTDGVHALYPHGLYWGETIPDQPVIATPVAAGVFMPGLNVVAEFRNDVLNDYFLTAYQTETDLLDSSRIESWQRTGQTLTAWTSIVSVKTGERPPPNLLPVCRIWLGNSHFYSISAPECAAVAQFPAFLETAAAFYATLPNPDAGACPVDQTPVYRLWNANGSSHRYTTQVAVRDDMKARGWIAEGYGPDPVAMCVGGAR